MSEASATIERPSKFKAKNLWLILTMVSLIFLLFLQIIWFNGTNTLRDYQTYSKEILRITEEISRVQAAAQSDGRTESPSTRALVSPLIKKLDYLDPQMESAIVGLQSFNKHWLWKFVPGSYEAAGSSPQADVRVANSLTQVLGLYILPLMYGVLGALLSIVQKIREDDSDEALVKLRPSPRLITGAVAGPMIGMFISPEFLNSLAFQATPFLIAFIGGYATDVFFALIDKFLANFRTTVGKPFPGTVATPDQSAAASKGAEGAAAPLGADKRPEGTQ